MKNSCLLLISLILVSCSGDKQPAVVSKNKDSSVSIIEKPSTPINTTKNKIEENSRWTTTSQTSNYMVDITFHDEYLLYWYHGQCIYYYFTHDLKDSIELTWSYKTDCLLNMDLLESTHGLKKYPKKGDAFSSYKLMNDSTLKATYYFPEWTKKINQVAKDTIFPDYFKKVPL